MDYSLQQTKSNNFSQLLRQTHLNSVTVNSDLEEDTKNKGSRDLRQQKGNC